MDLYLAMKIKSFTSRVPTGLHEGLDINGYIQEAINLHPKGINVIYKILLHYTYHTLLDGWDVEECLQD